MFLSNLLGPVKKPIFEIMYRSSLRVAIQLEETGIELKTFSSRFLRLARADNLKIDVVESQRYFYLIEKIAWLILIPPERDLQIVRAEFLERLTYTNDVVGAFVLVCDFPPRWAWAQVSEGKRMKAQARKREVEMQESVQMAVYS
ncbi:MAG: hypothetical protein IT312_13235 [Anaerolineales bacterium]|nr:hypothetical protein [Anaerolineales bacterium]